MNLFLRSAFVVALLIFAGSNLYSQVATAPPAGAEEEALEMFEFTEADLPKYDESEMAGLVQYPDLARKNGIEGTVLVGFIVETNGQTSNLEIVQSDNHMFNETSLAAVRQVRFTPGTKNGQPVRAKMVIPIRFTLRNR